MSANVQCGGYSISEERSYRWNAVVLSVEECALSSGSASPI